jgi:hypothetical protein
MDELNLNEPYIMNMDTLPNASDGLPSASGGTHCSAQLGELAPHLFYSNRVPDQDKAIMNESAGLRQQVAELVIWLI